MSPKVERKADVLPFMFSVEQSCTAEHVCSVFGCSVSRSQLSTHRSAAQHTVCLNCSITHTHEKETSVAAAADEHICPSGCQCNRHKNGDKVTYPRWTASVVICYLTVWLWTDLTNPDSVVGTNTHTHTHTHTHACQWPVLCAAQPSPLCDLCLVCASRV